jgi:hypothetical protein
LRRGLWTDEDPEPAGTHDFLEAANVHLWPSFSQAQTRETEPHCGYWAEASDWASFLCSSEDPACRASACTVDYCGHLDYCGH